MQSINEYINHIYRGETQFIGDANEPVGWQTVFYDKDNSALGGGVSSSLETSKRIAIAEVCERKALREISRSENNSKIFHMNTHPTSCGFAAGFEEEKVELRSIAEALERWAWSKWIDDGYILKESKLSKLSSISKNLIKNFDEVMLFKKEFDVETKNGRKKFVLNIFLGFSKQGVFPGSRVTMGSDCGVEHAIVEAFRHLMIFNADSGHDDIVYQRIKFFGRNKVSAQEQIRKAIKFNWPKFEILMSAQYETNVESLYLFRTLPKNYIPWNEGSSERFVY